MAFAKHRHSLRSLLVGGLFLTHCLAIAPFWGASRPEPGKPLQGYQKVPNRTDVVVYMPRNEGTRVGCVSDKTTNRVLTCQGDGLYNHAAMIQYHAGAVHITWKNAPRSEDTPGQRGLYAFSRNGHSFSKAVELFPNMSTGATPVAHFAGLLL